MSEEGVLELQLLNLGDVLGEERDVADDSLLVASGNDPPLDGDSVVDEIDVVVVGVFHHGDDLAG